MGLEVVCCLRLPDSLAYLHLAPIARHPDVSKIWIVRHAKIEYGDIPKAEYVIVDSKWRLVRFARMLAACAGLARRDNVRLFVSFNPLPYGLFSLAAAKWRHKKIHFGFIGQDWNRHCRGALRSWLAGQVLRRVDLISAAGPAMRQEISRLGIPADRLFVSPHTVDLSRFPVRPERDEKYTCIFIGRLIRLKHVDTILRAFQYVVQSYPESRLCVVGDGPQLKSLQRLAGTLDITEYVDFAGYQKDVRPYLSASRMLIVASDSEGFPFTLVEAMATGVVPLTTPVGCIPDYISDQETGLFFEPGNYRQLADKIQWLLEKPEAYAQLRANILKLRPALAIDHCTQAWDEHLTRLARQDSQKP